MCLFGMTSSGSINHIKFLIEHFSLCNSEIIEVVLLYMIMCNMQKPFQKIGNLLKQPHFPAVVIKPAKSGGSSMSASVLSTTASSPC